MLLVTIQSKDLPKILHQKAGLAVSALVTVRFEKNKITLTPQSALERAIAAGLEDARQGRTYGPFTAKQLDTFLDKHKIGIAKRTSNRT
jgi:hypothetical protein